jgi:aryl-alcohol dehydrogenase-like predicted oxidoreductase
MPLDHYVTLGRSGLRVSPFALGAMTFGEDPPGIGSSVEESEKILATYLDLGGNFIDTANFYANGHAEKIVGDFFAARPGRRRHVVLASKFFGNMFPGDPNGGGAGRTAIIAQLAESLRRMQTDYLDLYWLHSWDRNTPIEETMRTLDDLTDPAGHRGAHRRGPAARAPGTQPGRAGRDADRRPARPAGRGVGS